MNIEVWSIGKGSDPFVKEGLKHYLNRLKPYIKVNIKVLAPPKRTAGTTPEESKLLEEKIILSKLNSSHYLILLDERGKALSSIQWAEEVSKLQNSSVKTLVFLIGGPWGVTEKIKRTAQKTWSLSTLTYPHQLVRLILAEQIYRSFSIMNNSNYHHE